MKIFIISTTLLLASCSVNDVTHHLLENVTQSDIGRNAASCNQIKTIIEIIQATIATILSGKATMVASVVHAAINSFPKSKRQ